jgi:hypothetical protein
MSLGCRFLSIPALLALAVPTSATAAPAKVSSNGTVAILNPLGVLKRTDLDFGTIIVSPTAGTAVMDPLTGLTTTGGLLSAGTAAHPATFTGTGSKNSIVHVKLPTGPITVKRVGGTQTMTVSAFTTDAPKNLKVPANQVFNFAVGATLNVGANQAVGTYVGTFSVTVQYP